VAGTLAALPFLLSEPSSSSGDVALALAGVLPSCLLFGAVYRYALRQDLHNNHLKVRPQWRACSWTLQQLAVAQPSSHGCDEGKGCLMGPCIWGTFPGVRPAFELMASTALCTTPLPPPAAMVQGGVVAAFGLVRGLAQATDSLAHPAAVDRSGDDGSSTLATAAVSSAAGSSALATGPFLHALLLAGESVLTFAAAAVAVELAFRWGLVKPLPGSGGSAVH
jgi:hypothetical protein